MGTESRLDWYRVDCGVVDPRFVKWSLDLVFVVAVAVCFRHLCSMRLEFRLYFILFLGPDIYRIFKSIKHPQDAIYFFQTILQVRTPYITRNHLYTTILSKLITLSYMTTHNTGIYLYYIVIPQNDQLLLQLTHKSS